MVLRRFAWPFGGQRASFCGSFTGWAAEIRSRWPRAGSFSIGNTDFIFFFLVCARSWRECPMGLVGTEFQVVFDLPPGLYQVRYARIAWITPAPHSDYVLVCCCTVYGFAARLVSYDWRACMSYWCFSDRKQDRIACREGLSCWFCVCPFVHFSCQRRASKVCRSSWDCWVVVDGHRRCWLNVCIRAWMKGWTSEVVIVDTQVRM